MSGKYEKSRFVGVRRTKISEKRLSPARENQKSAKNGFPPRGKIKNQRKSAFPHGGKSEISEKRLSPARENQKSAKSSFPPRGKIKKRRWLHFLLLRKTKKTRKFDKTTFGGQFTFYILSFGIYRPGNCYFLFFSLEMTLYSEGDMP